MNEQVAQIMSMFAKLNEKEQKQVAAVLSKQLETPLSFSAADLSSLGEDRLDFISKVLGGMILTKENVPDIREAYEMFKGKDLPSRVSFGRMEEK